MLDWLRSTLSNVSYMIDAAIAAARERLRPECRRVIFRAIVLGAPTAARCGDPIDLTCTSGYCREHCHLFCHCGACGCEAGGHARGETVYDAAAAPGGSLPS